MLSRSSQYPRGSACARRPSQQFSKAGPFLSSFPHCRTWGTDILRHLPSWLVGMGKGTVTKPRQPEGRARVSQTAKMGVAEEAERCALLLSDFSPPQPQRTPWTLSSAEHGWRTRTGDLTPPASVLCSLVLKPRGTVRNPKRGKEILPDHT